ncbi:MAG: hypothetical protein CMH52_11055 [Myxococcales bacterium]|nr:hypothetical protein [Myxococcales bacterium]
MANNKILILDVIEDDLNRLAEIVESIGISIVKADSQQSALVQCEQGVSCVFFDPTGESINPTELYGQLDKLGLPFVCVSKDSSREDVLNALRSGCLDWLDKPVEAEAVRSAFRRVEKRAKISLVEDKQKSSSATGRGLIAEIAKRIRDGNVDLPEVPDIVKELNQLLVNLDVEADAVQAVVERDPSLAARLVATVNTATYGGAYWKGQITDVKACVTRLGNQAIRNLVQTDAVKGMFQFRSPAFKAVFDKMWRCHFMSACLARDVAEAAELGEVEEVYLVGLIHNIGELFLLRVFGELFQRQNNQVLSMDEVLDMVRDYHCVFGEALVKKWDLGDQFAFVTRHHHDLKMYRDTEDESGHVKLMHCINLADQLVNYTGATYYTKALPAPSLQESYQVIEVDADAKEKLRHRAEEMYGELFG